MKLSSLFLLVSAGARAFSTPGHFSVTKTGPTNDKFVLSASSTDEDTKVTDIFYSRSANETAIPNPFEVALPPQDTLSSFMDSMPGWFEPAAWRGVIVILCALWGSNFAAAKLVMAEPGVDSSLYAVARFGVAAAALAPGAIGSLKRANLDWETTKGALQCGSWVAFGYLGQTVGLLTTTASRSCVICSMHCVFVAVIAEYWRVSRSEAPTEFDTRRLFPAALAVLGVAIVELQGAAGAPTIGDALSFAQPIGFGMGYLQLEELMKKNPEAALPVSALKLAVVAASSFILFELTPLFNGAQEFAFAVPDFSAIIASPLALGGILYTGLITTAFALWIESIAFAKVPATDASIILTTEPLIAAFFGAVALGETFGFSDYVGASLIIGACALAVVINDEKKCEPEDEVCEAEKLQLPFLKS